MQKEYKLFLINHRQKTFLNIGEEESLRNRGYMEHQINAQGQKRNCLCHNVLKTLNIQNKESTLKVAKQKKPNHPQRQACQNGGGLISPNLESKRGL